LQQEGTVLVPNTLLVNGINGVVKTGKIYLILMILSDSESDYESDGESDSMSDTSEAFVDNDGDPDYNYYGYAIVYCHLHWSPS